MKFYTTGEVAGKLNISVRTLRYYGQIGLISPTQKGKNGKRLYNKHDLLTLEKITILKMLHLSLTDIKKIISKITTEQLLLAHKKSLHQNVEELTNSINHTNQFHKSLPLQGKGFKTQKRKYLPKVCIMVVDKNIPKDWRGTPYDHYTTTESF